VLSGMKCHCHLPMLSRVIFSLIPQAHQHFSSAWASSLLGMSPVLW
jgi:hypothetical protein